MRLLSGAGPTALIALSTLAAQLDDRAGNKAAGQQDAHAPDEDSSWQVARSVPEQDRRQDDDDREHRERD